MIIRFPTALYSNQLPQGTSAGNITWTISTDNPKTSQARFIQIPLAAQLMKRPPAIFNPTQRRAAVGDLAYTLVNGETSEAGNGQPQFETGQILDFTDTDIPPILAPAQTPSVVEIQHNLSVLDLESIGLSDDDINTLTQQATTKKAVLEEQLAALQSQINTTANQISENQRKINETAKTINVAQQLYGIQPGDVNFPNPIYQKLLGIQTGLLTDRDTLAALYQSLVIQSSDTYTALLQVSELVK